MSTVSIGVDLAKVSFSACDTDAGGRVRQRKDFRRDAFAAWLPQLPGGTVVAMEACSGAHHWARRCQNYGLTPRLIAAQFVTPFRKSRTTKNERNDAEAIAIAARQGNMRFVPVKTVDQHARLTCHRVREGCKTQALATSNRLGGLLAEFGVVVAQNDHALRRALAELSVRSALPVILLELLDDVTDHGPGKHDPPNKTDYGNAVWQLSNPHRTGNLQYEKSSHQVVSKGQELQASASCTRG